MSISGAVAELNKEIERLIKIRDSLVQGASETATRATVAAAPVTAAKKPVGRSSCGQAGDVCRHAEEDVGFRQGPGRRKGDRREVTRSQAGAKLPPD
jgi:hypothetical protein